MILSWIKNKVHHSRRKTPRYKIQNQIQCFASSNRVQEKNVITIMDLSENGFSYSARIPSSEIGETVTLAFHLSDDRIVEKTATVLSQRLYYPDGSEDLQNAVYRFSGSFEQAFDPNDLLQIRA